MSLDRYRHARRDSLSEFWSVQSDLYLESLEKGAAFLLVIANDSLNYAEFDPNLIAEAGRLFQEAIKPFTDAQRGGAQPWSVIAYPTQAWAARVFPDLERGGGRTPDAGRGVAPARPRDVQKSRPATDSSDRADGAREFFESYQSARSAAQPLRSERTEKPEVFM